MYTSVRSQSREQYSGATCPLFDYSFPPIHSAKCCSTSFRNIVPSDNNCPRFYSLLMGPRCPLSDKFFYLSVQTCRRLDGRQRTNLTFQSCRANTNGYNIIKQPKVYLILFYWKSPSGVLFSLSIISLGQNCLTWSTPLYNKNNLIK